MNADLQNWIPRPVRLLSAALVDVRSYLTYGIFACTPAIPSKHNRTCRVPEKYCRENLTSKAPMEETQASQPSRIGVARPDPTPRAMMKR